MSHADDVLQAAQFFRERIARAEDYQKHHGHSHNGESDKDADENDQQNADDVREIAAHQNVFHRP